MIKTLVNAWKVEDLRKRILFTIMILVVFRFGSIVPVPFLNAVALKELMGSLGESGAVLEYFDMLSGGAFAQATLFALSVQPYINASIIMQLMTVALPVLESLQKEGEEGRKRIMAITRIVTIFIGLMQGLGYYTYLRNNKSPSGIPIVKHTQGLAGIFTAIIIVFSFTAGTALMMWFGEQINENGIGNGISILLFAGNVSRMPVLITKLASYFSIAVLNPIEKGKYFWFVPLFVFVYLAMMWMIVFMNDAERRIPIQYAQKTVGRKIYAGQSSHIPLKISLSGVMPVIFASSILSLPSLISFFVKPQGTLKKILETLSINGWIHTVLYCLFILMFAYFYVSITYNPLEMANNLKQSNGAIPGIRPGKPTTDYFARVLSKITLLDASFLAFIALFPILLCNLTEMRSLSFGGTSIIIMVGVALETVRSLQSQMMMRHYKGFLD